MTGLHPGAAGLEVIPARFGALITPNDATVFAHPTRAVIVGTTGTLEVRFLSGQVVIIPENIVGSLVHLPICVDKILNTNTTASEILVLW